MLIKLKSLIGLMALPTATASFQIPAVGAVVLRSDSACCARSSAPSGRAPVSSGAPAGRISARSFPLAPRSSPVSALSDASVRYAAFGASELAIDVPTIGRGPSATDSSGERFAASAIDQVQ